MHQTKRTLDLIVYAPLLANPSPSPSPNPTSTVSTQSPPRPLVAKSESNTEIQPSTPGFECNTAMRRDKRKAWESGKGDGRERGGKKRRGGQEEVEGVRCGLRLWGGGRGLVVVVGGRPGSPWSKNSFREIVPRLPLKWNNRTPTQPHIEKLHLL